MQSNATWTIVETTESKGVFICTAPTKWIDGDKLFWPLENEATLVMSGTKSPRINWKKIPCKVLSAPFETFELAKASEKQFSSSSSEADVSQKDGPPQKKIRCTKAKGSGIKVNVNAKVRDKLSVQTKSPPAKNSVISFTPPTGLSTHLKPKILFRKPSGQPTTHSLEAPSQQAEQHSSDAVPAGFRDDMTIATILANQKVIINKLASVSEDIKTLQLQMTQNQDRWQQIESNRTKFERELISNAAAELHTLFADIQIDSSSKTAVAKRTNVFNKIQTAAECLEFEENLKSDTFFQSMVSN